MKFPHWNLDIFRFHGTRAVPTHERRIMARIMATQWYINWWYIYIYLLDLQTSIYFWLPRLLHTCVRSRPQKVVVYQNECFWLFLKELALTYINLGILWFCGPECLDPAKIALDPSVGFNNSLIDCSIGFGLRRFVSKRGDDRKHLKSLCKSWI